MTLYNLHTLLWAILLFAIIYRILSYDWGSFLCRVGIHHDETAVIMGVRQGLSVCVRCGRTAEFDFMPDDERID